MSQAAQTSNFQSRLFRPQVLDIEQVILHAIEETILSAVKVAQLGDVTQANTVFIMMTLNLDNFVFPILTADKNAKWKSYTEQRKKIYDKWPAPNSDKSAINEARDLFKLTCGILAAERLFKHKQYSSFGIGWQKGQQVDMEKLNEEDEGEEENES